ncbi:MULTISPECIES: hypothetical protein [unclassified Endozoicomonas]|uniref:hypothetical protein n=1 Tax=unclassified Endozoicomonas TaxID=2644528 RepID=UPI0021491E6D|nr:MULTISPECIES: hypothetical protein [unclassified Endozoicomonas]
MRALYFTLFFFMTCSLAGDFTEAIRENNFNKVKELMGQGYQLEYDQDALPDALCFGSLEMLIFLLNNGANPNSFTSKETYNSLTISHILADASTISQIVTLLSHGASPAHDYNWEFNHAIGEKKWLHLTIYYYWERMLIHKIPTPPNSISELNSILSSLPLLAINSLVTFIEHQPNLENLLSLLPNNLKFFFDYLKYPK